MRKLSRRMTIIAAGAAFAIGIPLGVAIAGAGFSDVPPSNPFYADINALDASGVSHGCGGGKFCPKDNVTREQMAAFMNRLGALSPTKTPVVNAAKLDGKTSSAFHQYGTTAPNLSTQYGSFSVEGTAAGAGALGAANISYPVPINAELTPHVIKIGDPLPTGCSGSVTNPGAGAGHLCIFVGYSLNIATSGSSPIVYDPTDGFGGTSHFGAFVQIATTGASSFVFSGSWAATAPLTLTLLPPSSGAAAGQ
jgi:hypothetical protein